MQTNLFTLLKNNKKKYRGIRYIDYLNKSKYGFNPYALKIKALHMCGINEWRYNHIGGYYESKPKHEGYLI